MRKFAEYSLLARARAGGHYTVPVPVRGHRNGTGMLFLGKNTFRELLGHRNERELFPEIYEGSQSEQKKQTSDLLHSKHMLGVVKDATEETRKPFGFYLDHDSEYYSY